MDHLNWGIYAVEGVQKTEISKDEYDISKIFDLSSENKILNKNALVIFAHSKDKTDKFHHSMVVVFDVGDHFVFYEVEDCLHKTKISLDNLKPKPFPKGKNSFDDGFPASPFLNGDAASRVQFRTIWEEWSQNKHT